MVATRQRVVLECSENFAKFLRKHLQLIPLLKQTGDYNIFHCRVHSWNLALFSMGVFSQMSCGLMLLNKGWVFSADKNKLKQTVKIALML